MGGIDLNTSHFNGEIPEGLGVYCENKRHQNTLIAHSLAEMIKETISMADACLNGTDAV